MLGRGDGGCFYRAVGLSSTYKEDISELDRICSEKGYYLRWGKLPPAPSGQDSIFYDECYRQYISSEKRILPIKLEKKNPSVGALLAAGMFRFEDFCRRNENNFSESAVRSIIILSMYWTDCILLPEKSEWLSSEQKRIVIQSVSRRNEYLFAYFLTLIGFDVLLLNGDTDIALPKAQEQLSQHINFGSFSSTAVPPFKKTEPAKISPRPESSGNIQTSEYTPTVSLPVRTSPRTANGRNNKMPTPLPVNQRREKSYEELASLASSVVLILIHDHTGNIVSTGSGIMIGRDGYILTNFHVVKDGTFFTVRIENDDTDYNTDKVIKYNSTIDLAVIRIDRKLQPLPVYNGSKELVRGQKVVAIGSPLGLFNSVSDGIISGMREIREVDMIQFTAPISSGSSGGAVLNMYGEVIGISTAGIDNGQNINLAVSYQYINMFIKGFSQ